MVRRRSNSQAMYRDTTVHRFTLTVLWAAIAPYLVEQLRLLQSSYPVDVHLITRRPPVDLNTPYDEDVLRGVTTTLLSEDDLFNSHVVKESVGDPAGALLVCGWNNPAFRRIALDWPRSAGPVIMSLDTNFVGSTRQRLSRFRFPRFFRRVDYAYVPGLSGSRMAHCLGFRSHQVRSGVYSVNTTVYGKPSTARSEGASASTRTFLYVGRLIDRKGIDLLMTAYARYRLQVDQPWNLLLVGQGELAEKASAEEGVTVRGFVQPHDLPEIYRTADAFVLPSRYEPWGVVLAEAAASHLPLIVSAAVGSRHDLVVDGANGIVVPSDDVDALTAALRELSLLDGVQLASMGQLSALLAMKSDSQSSAATLFSMVAGQ